MSKGASGASSVPPVSADEIHRRFRGLIRSGLLGVGERLPTVRQTAGDFGVAPGTAARAYRRLEEEGLVVTRTAAGTRVAATAGALPAPVVRRVRQLVDDARSARVDLDELVDVLRLTWSRED